MICLAIATNQCRNNLRSTKDRFYGTSDPVANKISGRRARDEDQQQQKQESEEGGYEKARAILYMWIQGEEPWPKFDEMDVRDLFYAYWEIASRRQKPYYPSANADRLGMQRHE